MNLITLLISAAVFVPLVSSLWLALRLKRLNRLYMAAAASCEAARQGESIVTRTLQLFANELQAIALTLRGHTDALAAEQHSHAPIMAVVSAQLGGLADELGFHLMPDGQTRVINCEWLEVDDLVREGMEGMITAIQPGRRHWRIRSTESPPITIWADHRALRLVIVRVLGEAARTSRHDDFVEISWAIEPRGLVISVEDEGAGAALPAVAPVPIDSRGIGLRLSLARSLIQAHSGSLEVESLPGVGTRVLIILPADRVKGVA